MCGRQLNSEIFHVANATANQRAVLRTRSVCELDMNGLSFSPQSILGF